MRAPQRGITLIELLMTVAIASVLATMGVPALGSMLAHSHERSAEAALQASLMHARELAITRSEQVVVCPTADGEHCSGEDLWQAGWMIGADADHDREPDSVLARFDAMPENMRIVSSRGRPRVVFQPDGSAGGSNAQLTVCHGGDVRDGRAVVIANSGRVRVTGADSHRLRACLDGMD